MRIATLAAISGLVAGCDSSHEPAPERAAAAERPNVLVVIADDLGYGDLGCYGHAVATPALDALAASGLRFADFHASGPVCSPTRAGFLTGRYQQRAGITYVLGADPDGNRHHGLFEHEVTLPELLAGAGYATGLIGKWHLGYEPGFAPTVHSFGRFFGFLGGNIDYRSHLDMLGNEDVWSGTERATAEGYTTHWITDEAIAFLEEHRDGGAEEPFFLVVAHAAPHAPLQGPDDPPVRTRGSSAWGYPDGHDDRTTYRRMVLALDESVGALVACLERLELRDDTLVVFFSDNGGLEYASNGALRGYKGALHEGGHRVPAIASWPGRIEPGVSDELVTSLDWMPTILALAGVVPPNGHGLDGADVGPHLFDGEPVGARTMFWAYHNLLAVRSGDWKLVGTMKTTDERYRTRFELYDLANDLAEQTNLAPKSQQRVAELHDAWRAWRRDVQQGATRQPGR